MGSGVGTNDELILRMINTHIDDCKKLTRVVHSIESRHVLEM